MIIKGRYRKKQGAGCLEQAISPTEKYLRISVSPWIDRVSIIYMGYGGGGVGVCLGVWSLIVHIVSLKPADISQEYHRELDLIPELCYDCSCR